MDKQLAQKFINKMLEELDIKKIDPKRIAPRGFEIPDNKREVCILIIGLNPAGDENDADRENDPDRTYFYSITKEINIKSKWLYNSYYRPIYNFAKDVLGDNVKWPWCNKLWLDLEKEINASELSNYIDVLKEEYDNHSKHEYVIYIGDMFYYHETSSKSLPLSKKMKKKGTDDAQKYCKEMLDLHISELRNANKDVKFVYINNAQVSHWLCGDKIKTFEKVNGVKVFYGGMLSGMRSMDTFAKERLVNEIKQNI